MLQGLLNLVFYIIELIANIILTPIINLFNSVFPDLSGYMSNITNFLNSYVFPYMKFVKNAFMNITGFPQAMFNLLIGYLIIKIGLYTAIKTYTLIKKIWEMFKP